LVSSDTAIFCLIHLFFLTNAGFIKSCFDSFYDEEIIKEKSFNARESSGEEEPRAGVAIAASSEFLRSEKIM